MKPRNFVCPLNPNPKKYTISMPKDLSVDDFTCIAFINEIGNDTPILSFICDKKTTATINFKMVDKKIKWIVVNPLAAKLLLEGDLVIWGSILEIYAFKLFEGTYPVDDEIDMQAFLAQDSMVADIMGLENTIKFMQVVIAGLTASGSKAKASLEKYILNLPGKKFEERLANLKKYYQK